MLFPVTLIYDLVTRLRNYLYDIDYTRSFQFETMVINVGNLSMGGTGKTPMVEYLIKSLKTNFKITVLSRGYKRKSYGFRIANKNDDATTIGDEPFQFFQKYSDEIKIVVSEDRVYAIPNILFEFPDTEIVILDDGFQQRGIIPDLSILLTEYDKPFFKDLILPTGNLRESRTGARRADVIVVTKCPDELEQIDMDSYVKKIEKYANAKPVYFSFIRYLDPKPVLSSYEGKITPGVIIFSGLANPDPLRLFVTSKFDVLDYVVFSDHHIYTFKDLENLISMLDGKSNISLLTTEKDRAKLISSKFYSLLEGVPLFYLPIEIDFVGNGRKFDKIILDAVKRNEFT